MTPKSMDETTRSSMADISNRERSGHHVATAPRTFPDRDDDGGPQTLRSSQRGRGFWRRTIRSWQFTAVGIVGLLLVTALMTRGAPRRLGAVEAQASAWPPVATTAPTDAERSSAVMTPEEPSIAPVDILLDEAAQSGHVSRVQDEVRLLRAALKIAPNSELVTTRLNDAQRRLTLQIDAYGSRARASFARLHFDEAIRDWERVVELAEPTDPRYTEARQGVDAAHRKQGRPSTSTPSKDLLGAVPPSTQAADRTRAPVARASKGVRSPTRRATRAAPPASTMDPNAEILARARRALEAHDYAGALGSLDAAVSPDVGDGGARNALREQVLIARREAALHVSSDAARKEGATDWRAALDAYTRAAAIDPELPAVGDAIRRVQSVMERSAVEAFRSARIYDARGLVDQAESLYERAIRDLPVGPELQAARDRLSELRAHRK